MGGNIIRGDQHCGNNKIYKWIDAANVATTRTATIEVQYIYKYYCLKYIMISSGHLKS